MRKKTFFGNTPRAIAIVAAFALFGTTGAGFAQQQVEMTSTAAARNPVAPAFTPSDEATFEAAFARFDTPVEPQLPDHAVDITTIEPATPPPAPAATSLGTGVASYYGRRFHGRRTANGERFNMNEMTAAHRTLPFGSRVRVTNTSNGQSVIVRINDRGPFIRGREIDVSRAAAEEIGMIRRGHSNVELELLDS
ncbi:septal ring lytic transglycosylase RlpA family protein [Aurantiacibacter marinus]|uniref:septal ring lytic transglycosylase RlpA family protein n=1 Tax=Aurantiacibacter marinus TaxID=874156 RepID=UPI001E3C5107|nr:septal ring lytic transglycosylase RlpA family protein [Aurantiacibacter marinus]